MKKNKKSLLFLQNCGDIASVSSFFARLFFSAVTLMGVASFQACNDIDKPEKPDKPEETILFDELQLVGNCKNEDMSAIELRFPGGVKAYTVSSKLKASALASDKFIVGVRAFVAEDASEITVFAGVDYQNPTVRKTAVCTRGGWQMVFFDEALPIEPETNYCIGYSTESEYMMVEDTRKTMRDELILTKDGWKEILSEYGKYVLSIEAVTTGGDYSTSLQNDFVVDRINMPEYAASGELLDVKVDVRNAGIRTNRKFTVKVDIDGRSNSVNVDKIMYNGSSTEVIVPVKSSSADKFKQTVTATVSMEGDDVDSNNILSAEQRIYADLSLRRNCVYIDFFTGQACPNCPHGAEVMANAIAGLEEPDKVCYVSHHTYHRDMFTLDECNDVAEAVGFDAAPQCNINRVPVKYDKRRNAELQWTPSENYDITGILSSMLAEPAHATLTIGRIFDENSRTLKIKASGKVMKPYANITVIVNQDSIFAAQSGASDSYVHKHVPRKYLTASLGDRLSLDSQGNYSVEYEYIIPDAIADIDTDVSNMEVVVLLHGNPAVADERIVYNADRISVMQ